MCSSWTTDILLSVLFSYFNKLFITASSSLLILVVKETYIVYILYHHCETFWNVPSVIFLWNEYYMEQFLYQIICFPWSTERLTSTKIKMNWNEMIKIYLVSFYHGIYMKLNENLWRGENTWHKSPYVFVSDIMEYYVVKYQ